MAKEADRQSRSIGWMAAGVVGTVLFVFGAIAFTNSLNTSQTLDEAAALHAADMTLAAQDVALKSVGQLVLLAQDFELGVAAREAVDAAAAEANRAVSELRTRSGALATAAAEMASPAVDEWEQTAGAVVALATGGAATSASAMLVESLVPLAESFADDLTVERDERAVAVDDAGRSVGRLSQVAGFLTAFLLPLGAMLAYRQSLRRQLEVAEAHLDARLEAERGMSRAKDQFIANISHELRTPLTSIYGFSEVLLEQGFVDPDVAKDLVGLINSESAELARMVEDLLVAAHLEDTKLAIESSPVSMPDELEAVLEPFRRRGISIGGTRAAGTVAGDQLRIRQIIRNLLSNAEQHGGPTIRVCGDCLGSNYVVSVEDDGPGVPDRLLPRLFSRFVHQGEAPLTTGSVGLGLAVAHLLADAMKGSLDHERITGRTRFVLTLPLVGTTKEDTSVDDLLVPSTQ